MSESPEDAHWTFGDFDSSATYACMARVSYAVGTEETNAILRTAWDELLETDCCVAARRYSWGMFLATSDDQKLGANLFEILCKIGCESIAFVVCPLGESVDKTIANLEAELLSANSYWHGIKIMIVE